MLRGVLSRTRSCDEGPVAGGVTAEPVRVRRLTETDEEGRRLQQIVRGGWPSLARALAARSPQFPATSAPASARCPSGSTRSPPHGPRCALQLAQRRRRRYPGTDLLLCHEVKDHSSPV